jgi:hypothetical protein
VRSKEMGRHGGEEMGRHGGEETINLEYSPTNAMMVASP